MLDCKEVLDHLSEYIGGEGSDELRKAILLHIARCGRCRIVFDTTGKMLKIVMDVEPFEVPLGVSARLYARLEKVLAEE